MDFLKRIRTRLGVSLKKKYYAKTARAKSEKPKITGEKLTVIYRISDGGRTTNKPDYITKENCLRNAIEHFPLEACDWFVIADNVSDETCRMIRKYVPADAIWKTSLGNAGSFRACCKKALEKEDDSIVYLLEDDYVHRPNSLKVLIEGIELGEAEYVSLYDHPDKYTYGTSKNPFIKGGEKTRVFLTDTTHWKITSSTTMTFATRVGTLRADWPIINRWTVKRALDFYMFIDLRRKGRRLISPIPSYATHGQHPFIAPLVDWEKEL
ncbi:hypothetical protein [Viscerimonas tarda]